eukprot:TRINITY_DN971_c1_g1_i2.p1 TRINITY_DN971_c1_g1~~TRINITY_DN971_c1_g1_i2.p1  ORF type:complete len:200 (+),score=63.52 TRINITY_DN971_c1_g1_i2:627-1226(+)
MSSTRSKICILGDGGVGKTAFTIQFCTNTFISDYDPTIEDSYRKQVVVDDDVTMVEILDTAGQEEFKALRDQWIRGCEGFIVMYSIDSLSSFEEVNSFIENIEIVMDKRADQLNIIVVGNKCDLEDEREVSTEAGENMAKSINAIFKEASAKTRTNVEESIFDIIRKMRQNPVGSNNNSNNKKSGGSSDKKSGGICNLL